MSTENEMKQRGTFTLIRTTLQGYKTPDLGARGGACLIHTKSCIYVLDEDGFCQDVLPLGVALAKSMDRIKGAQYVASLEPFSVDGLVADPRPGTRALFIGRGTGHRQALLRTGPITRVDLRESDGAAKERRPWGASDVELGWPAPEDPTRTYQQLPAARLPD